MFTFRFSSRFEVRASRALFDRAHPTIRACPRTMLPRALVPDLTVHLASVKAQHEADLEAGAGRVWLPDALAVKYPRAPWDWGRQWVFPATRHYIDRETGVRRRHHLYESVLQRAFKSAVRESGLSKAATCHYTDRHTDS